MTHYTINRRIIELETKIKSWSGKYYENKIKNFEARKRRLERLKTVENIR